MDKAIGALIFATLSAFTAPVFALDSVGMANTSAVPLSIPYATAGAGCSGIGATAFSTLGEILSCQSGVWRSSGGADVGPSTSISFNRSYCLGFSAFVYGHIYGSVRDSMGLHIVVNNSIVAIARADTEGWHSYESVSTIVAAGDCFSISQLTATGNQNVAWYRRI